MGHYGNSTHISLLCFHDQVVIFQSHCYDATVGAGMVIASDLTIYFSTITYFHVLGVYCQMGICARLKDTKNYLTHANNA